MYQFESSTFLPWQHYYSQRINGPLFLTDQRLETGQQGRAKLTSNRKVAWEHLWEKALKDIPKEPVTGDLVITSWVRTSTWKFGEDEKYLYEIVKNLSGKILKQYTFSILKDNGISYNIRYSNLLPSTVCRLIKELEPTDTDKDTRRLMQQLIDDNNDADQVRKMTREQLLQRSARRAQREAEKEKRKAEALTKATSEDDDEGSEFEADSDDDRKEQECKECEELLKEIKSLGRKAAGNYISPPVPTSKTDLSYLRGFLDKMVKQVKILREIRVHEGHEEDKITGTRLQPLVDKLTAIEKKEEEKEKERKSKRKKALDEIKRKKLQRKALKKIKRRELDGLSSDEEEDEDESKVESDYD